MKVFVLNRERSPARRMNMLAQVRERALNAEILVGVEGAQGYLVDAQCRKLAVCLMARRLRARSTIGA